MQQKQVMDHCWVRVWLVDCHGWRGAHWAEVPPHATAVEPALAGCVSVEEGQAYCETFNRAMLDHPRPLRAVCVNVALDFRGDMAPGVPVSAVALRACASEQPVEISRRG